MGKETHNRGRLNRLRRLGPAASVSEAAGAAAARTRPSRPTDPGPLPPVPACSGRWRWSARRLPPRSPPTCRAPRSVRPAWPEPR